MLFKQGSSLFSASGEADGNEVWGRVAGFDNRKLRMLIPAIVVSGIVYVILLSLVDYPWVLPWIILSWLLMVAHWNSDWIRRDFGRVGFFADALAGAVWGVLPFFMDVKYEGLVLIMLAVVTSVCVIHATVFWSVVVFCVVTLAPFVLQLVLLDDSVHVAMASVITMYLGTLLAVSWRIYGYHLSNRTGHENESERLNQALLGNVVTDTGRSFNELSLLDIASRSVAESVPIFIARFDKNGRVCYMNLCFQQYLGANADAIVGKMLCEISSHDVFVAFHEVILKVVATGKSVEFDQANIYAVDVGSPQFHHLRFSAERGAEGLGLNVLMVGYDISEEKQMADILYTREKTYQTLVENLPTAIARFGLNGRITYVNSNMSAWFGGWQASGLKQTESLMGLYKNVLSVLATGETREVDYQWKVEWGGRYGVIKVVPEYDLDNNIRSVLAVGHDVTDIQQYQQQIQDLAFFNPLTHLPNRALFSDRIRQSLKKADRNEYVVGLLVLDIDRLKIVNDTLGHVVGDALLCEVAVRIRRVVRTSDTVAHIGSDEFAIILPKVRDNGDLSVISDKIIAAMAPPLVIDGRELFISVSIGIALYPSDGSDMDQLLKHASAALHFAKSIGRSNIQFYSKELTDGAGDCLLLESELRGAIQREELEMYYQPKIDLSSQQVIGAEALIRWNHPQYGTLSPDRFIGIAEDTGLIIEIGEWVLVEGCRRAVLWNQLVDSGCKIAINVSSKQFVGDDLTDIVRRALLNTGCRPEWIELEITESLLLDERGSAGKTLRALAELGISIAIDDFGTGYSALIYLIRYPITILKIDRSFINEVITRPENTILVQAIIAMARSLNMQVVAEGVEISDQANWLAAAGCSIGQGYLWGAPMTADRFEAKFYKLDRTVTKLESSPLRLVVH
jgi:diguanylate cyclase (GGDEF)-like protein/PAS domain S-box-containing protein